MKKHSVLALLLALSLLLTGLLPMALAEEGAGDPVIATVNGQELLKSEVDSYATMIINYYSNYGYDLSDDASMVYVRQMAMETAVQDIFYKEKAAEFGADKLSPEEVEALNAQVESDYSSVVDQIMQLYGLTPAEDASEEDKANARKNAEDIASSYGYDRTSMLEDATESLIMKKVGDELSRDRSVSDEDVMNSFLAHVNEDMERYAEDPGAYEMDVQYYSVSPYYTPEGFRGIKHILLEVDKDLLEKYNDLFSRFQEQQAAAADGTESAETGESTETENTEETEETVPVTQEEVDEARAAVLASVQDTVDEIMTKYESGTSFADLIEEYGTDPGMLSEPYKTDGYSVFADSSIYDPVFTEAAFSVDNVGDISKPYVSSFGVHIIEYTRDVPSGAVELTDEMKAQIREELENDLYQSLLNEAYTEWMNQAVIEYTEEGEAYRFEIVENIEDAEAMPEVDPLEDDLEEEPDEDASDAADTDTEAQEGNAEAAETEAASETGK